MLGILNPCAHEGGCMLQEVHHDPSFSRGPSSDPLSSIYPTGAAARFRRKQDDYFANHKGLAAIRQRSMEEVHGVDVSWLHHPGKEHPRKNAPAPPKHNINRKPVGSPSPPAEASPLPPRTSSLRPPQASNGNSANASAAPTSITPATPAQPSRDTAPVAASATATLPGNGAVAATKAQQKRPGLLHRASSERSGNRESSRRTSWLNNISSKFSSSSSQQTVPERPAPPPAQPAKQANANGSPAPVAANGQTALPPMEEAEEVEATPTKAKEPSFFSNLTRRLSSASTSSAPRYQAGSGGLCSRKVLNVDPNRQRVLVPEMDPNRLRKVSFCVDVEIAGGPRYLEEDEEREMMAKKKDVKMKERAEGEALKRPRSLEDEKEKEGEIKLDARSTKVLHSSKPSVSQGGDDDADGLGQSSSCPPGADIDGLNRKKEKKKKSEEERKDRKEKRRMRAVENGSIPVELPMGEDGDVSPDSETAPEVRPTRKEADQPPPIGLGLRPDPPAQTATNPQGPAARQDKPTTDPVRIYRRCCQLRETPILKRITEQLMKPDCVAPFEPGVVSCLDLTGSRLQLADMVTLGDWLAVVPVKNLRLEDADLNDEGLRCILAGLLAAKRPEPTKRRSVQPRHRQGMPARSYTERSGVIEKLTLKHNPRITRLGWKHISLFIYMCRSLKAIDLSMNQFPETFPASTHATPTKSPSNAPKGDAKDTDAAAIFYKCLSERLGGSKMEELIVSECGLNSDQIRKVVDGAIVCGISRLGLAGNHLDDEGLGHVIHYLRSSVCHGLDLGGNDLRGKLGHIADAINNKRHIPCWGLSLAGCNLVTADLKVLFPALVKLPDFRFLDLSHNRELCFRDNGTVSLFRRYMSQFKELKRVHLADVGMSPQQAIALADCLPDGPRLAHLNLLENPMLSALAHAKDEASQEEACALYASLMAAVRVSSTLICIDIDVPSQDNSEVVKALAKQVVAYSLRNMEQFAIAEATGIPTANATAKLTEPHGGERKVKEITVPDVLMHLVGHVEGNHENHDNDPPAPDGDYIVGGTGVVKALQYVLGEKAADLRRTSVPGTPVSGGTVPRNARPGSSAGLPPTEEQRGKAKKMSKNLLDSARKVRMRLQPALLKEATAGDELAYRRLLFLDQTLQSIIQRFEEEYPETRVQPPGSPKVPASPASSATESDRRTDLSLNTQVTEYTGNGSEDEDLDDVGAIKRPIKRHGSQVSLAARALSLEEGNLHRLGQRMRREIIDSPTTATADLPAEPEDERIRALQDKIESTSGTELKGLVESLGWKEALKKIGGNYEDLRKLQEMDPEGWEQFRESHMKARMNADRDWSR
ncbi:hypothetical protein BAUCODRAFT_401333 [Baudoinia panamericana UAMH 10762]|uniref:RNI-like protein n=1 Tax=Baudoinia panamericana (strain UAMH 10762) TaxID=717646 RepID=M2N5R5_BAUPA|nr:uncharacterized protein BAUCODRAFT_401333 [Baudoinia panamericana UAMH 10762]EMC99373.1 hypothetical protein BAUCODRAFT_401333 [Baudoinia panamericana UAMH 10762]